MLRYFAIRTPIDPQDAENSLEDCAKHLDQFVRTANSFHVKADDKYTRSIECVVFMITGGRVPTLDEMTRDEYDCDQFQILIQWI